MIRSTHSIALGCVLFTALTAQAGDAESDKLQGKWTVASFTYNGGAVERMNGAVREFNGDKYTLRPASGDAIEGTFKLDAGKDPKQIDLQLGDRTLKGIYQIDGDTLSMAYRLNGDERPGELASKADSGVILVVHKRAK